MNTPSSISISGLEDRPNGLALVEQAIQLLRWRGGAALVDYYIGTLPFVLGLLFFWSDMSRNPFARWYCGSAAAGLALLFIWMKLWQVRFGYRLDCVLQEIPASKWSRGQWISIAARQAGLQATGWILIPLACLATLPAAWVYAFYQNLTVMDGPGQKHAKSLIAGGRQQALLLPGQNHLMLTVMTLFMLVILANTAILLILAPQMAQRLLGIETIFTLSGFHLLNTTFLTVICGLTYLCVDPVIKAAYVLRCYSGRTRRTGEDIRNKLKHTIAAAVIAAVVIPIWGPPSAAAGQTPEVHTVERAELPAPEYARQLDRAIDQVLRQRHFTWRMPRETEARKPSTGTWLENTIEWIIDGLSTVLRTVGGWIERFWKWLTDRLPKIEKPTGDMVENWHDPIKAGFYLMGGVVLACLLWWLRTHLKSRRSDRSGSQAHVAVQPVDLSDESVTARDLPAERWLTLASEMIAKEDLRRALRALYLAVLALLADQGRVVIARFKTNQDYYTELARRQHNESELLNRFDRCRKAYDRVWYGMHAVSTDQVNQFKAHQERIADLVRPTA